MDDESNPLELAVVNVLSLEPSSPLRNTAFTDARGSVELSDARGLELRVSVQAPGFARRVLVVGAAADMKGTLELKLARGALVQGRVTKAYAVGKASKARSSR